MLLFSTKYARRICSRFSTGIMLLLRYQLGLISSLHDSRASLGRPVLGDQKHGLTHPIGDIATALVEVATLTNEQAHKLRKHTTSRAAAPEL